MYEQYRTHSHFVDLSDAEFDLLFRVVHRQLGIVFVLITLIWTAAILLLWIVTGYVNGQMAIVLVLLPLLLLKFFDRFVFKTARKRIQRHRCIKCGCDLRPTLQDDRSIRSDRPECPECGTGIPIPQQCRHRGSASRY